MGYNTAAMFCNDGIDQLRKDPEAGERLYQAIIGHRDDRWVRIGNHLNCATVLRSEHADTTQVVLVGQNSIRRVRSLWGSVGYGDEDIAEALLARLADELGYNLSKKAWRKRKDAQGDTRPQGGDAQQAPFTSGPVAESDAPNEPRNPHAG